MIAVGIGFWYYYLPVIIVAGIIAFVSGVIGANHFIGNIEKAEELGDTTSRKRTTEFSDNCASLMMLAWEQLDHRLLEKYIDGNIKHEKEGRIETTPTGVVRFPQHPHYPDWFYRAIVNDHGSVLEVKE